MCWHLWTNFFFIELRYILSITVLVFSIHQGFHTHVAHSKWGLANQSFVYWEKHISISTNNYIRNARIDSPNSYIKMDMKQKLNVYFTIPRIFNTILYI